MHSPFLPLHRQNKEVWVSGLNQHIANVPNRKVPKVRNRLQRAQKPSLLGLCRASGDSQRNPSASAHWLVSSVGSEHDATNVGVGSSSLSRVTIIGGLAELVYCTGLENRQAATSQRFEIALSECRSQACLDYAECLAILIEIL